jgi:hypothetical protein
MRGRRSNPGSSNNWEFAPQNTGNNFGHIGRGGEPTSLPVLREIRQIYSCCKCRSDALSSKERLTIFGTSENSHNRRRNKSRETRSKGIIRAVLHIFGNQYFAIRIVGISFFRIFAGKNPIGQYFSGDHRIGRISEHNRPTPGGRTSPKTSSYMIL